MKKILTILTILTLSLSIAFLAYGGSVVGSRHDLSIGGTGWGGGAFGTTQVCVFCHAPHNTNKAQLNGQYLWNRTLQTTTFTLYSSSTIDATINQPGVQSLLCLSCHDGVGAFDVMINMPKDWDPALGSAMTNQFGDFNTNDPAIGPLNIGENGGNLSNDHPVGFVYDDTLAATDGALKTPVSTKSVDAGGKLRLFGSKVECSTCHNPHDNDVCSTPGSCRFMVMDNSGSALCTSCHIK